VFSGTVTAPLVGLTAIGSRVGAIEVVRGVRTRLDAEDEE
jgi:hypothetical protein